MPYDPASPPSEADASASGPPPAEPGTVSDGDLVSDPAPLAPDAPVDVPPSPFGQVAAPIPAPPPSPEGPRPSLGFLAVVSIVSLGLDLLTKWAAKAHLDDASVYPYKKVEVIKNHVAFVFARNRGGAWGLLQDENENLRRPFFLLISLAAVVFIVTLYRRLTPKQIALKWGLPLVLGGALGNLVDRIRYGFVVDFVDVYVKDSHWPTFNVADIAICVGVGLMAVDMFTSRRRAPITPPPASADSGAKGG
jgi:signal peptidase II